MGRIRRDRANRRQMETIVETMEKNSKLNRFSLSRDYTIGERQRDWAALCAKLNKDGEVCGAVKPVMRWQKCWSDYKCEVKKRYIAALNSQRSYLSPLEKRVIKLMGFNPEVNLDNPESQPFDLEISTVEALTDISSSKSELEESRNALTDPESSNSMPVFPEEYITVVKIEPEVMSKSLLKANDSTNSDRSTLASESSNIYIVPEVMPKGSLKLNDSTHSDRVTLASESNNIYIVPEVMPKGLLKPNDSTHSDRVTLASDSSNIYIVPEQIPVSKPPAVNDRNKTLIPAIGESSGGSLVKAQNACAGASHLVAKDLETVAEIKKDLKTIAEAFKSFAKAFETMTENQKTQLAIEERRTALFEKLINHFCS